MFIIVFSIIIGALVWRLRGWGGWSTSMTLKRFMATAPLMVIGFIFGGPHGMLAAATIFVMLMLPWGQWQDQGTVEDNDDLIGMTGRGCLQTLPAATILMPMTPSAIILIWAGAMMGPIYWLCWKTLRKIRCGTFIDGPTAWAELMTGGIIYGSFTATLIHI